MSELLEIVFDNVEGERVLSLLDELISSKSIIARIYNTTLGELPASHETLRERELILYHDSLTSISGDYFRIISCDSAKATIFIYNYNEGALDVSIYISNEDIIKCIDKNIQSSIMGWANLIRERFNAVSCYGGLDPAYDSATRIFTDFQVGPIFLW